MKKLKYFTSNLSFDLSKQSSDEAPKNPRDFILWFITLRVPTFYPKSDILHCHREKRRSLDDTYHLVNKRWPMSELEFLDLVISVSQGNHSNTKVKNGMKYIYFTFCPHINKIVMQGSVFRESSKVASYWGNNPSFYDENMVSPLLREYALNNL